MAPLKLTDDILAAAIEGLQIRKQRIDEKISEIRQMLNGGSRTEATGSTETAKPRKKRSAAVRKRMALAQRARYSKLRHDSEPTQAAATKPKKKRRMSAAGRKAISEATKKRWAAIKAAQKVA